MAYTFLFQGSTASLQGCDMYDPSFMREHVAQQDHAV